MTGGIDLSVGSVAAFSSVVAGDAEPARAPRGAAGRRCRRARRRRPQRLLACSRCGIPPFIATLATMLAAKGGGADARAATSTVAGRLGEQLHGARDEQARSAFLPWTIVVAGLVVLAAWFVLEHTSLGRTVLAVGGSAEARAADGAEDRRAPSGSSTPLAAPAPASPGCSSPRASAPDSRSRASAGSSRRSPRSSSAARCSPAAWARFPRRSPARCCFGLVFNILNFENGLGVISLSAPTGRR